MTLLNLCGAITITYIILRQLHVVQFMLLNEPLLAMIGLVFIITSALFALSIRCPKCGSSWWWYMLKSHTKDVKKRDLRTQKECPICGLSNVNVT